MRPVPSEGVTAESTIDARPVRQVGPRVATLITRSVVGGVALLLAALGGPLPSGLRWGLAGAAVTALALGTRPQSPAVEAAVAFSGGWSLFLVWLGSGRHVSGTAAAQFLLFGVITMAGVVAMTWRSAGGRR